MGIRPHGAHGFDRQSFIFGIGIAVGKEDRTGKTALIQQLLRGGLYRVEVHRLTDRAIGKRAFRYFKAQGAIDNGREIPSQAPSARPVAAAPRLWPRAWLPCAAAVASAACFEWGCCPAAYGCAWALPQQLAGKRLSLRRLHAQWDAHRVLYARPCCGKPVP